MSEIQNSVAVEKKVVGWRRLLTSLVNITAHKLHEKVAELTNVRIYLGLKFSSHITHFFLEKVYFCASCLLFPASCFTRNHVKSSENRLYFWHVFYFFRVS